MEKFDPIVIHLMQIRYIDENTIYIQNEEDSSQDVYLYLIDPSEITVSGFDSSKPTTKKQKVTIQFYRYTGTYKIEVSEKPHVHTEDQGTIVKEPTCTTSGLKEFKCTGCGEVLRTETINPLGHKWDQGVVTKQPTVTTVGEKTFTCSNCGATRTEEIAKLPASSLPSTSVTTEKTKEEATVKKPKKQVIVVSKKASKIVAYKFKKLKKKQVSFKIGAKAKTKITYTVPKKAKKYISVSKTGKVTVKKGCKKGTYKITVKATKTNEYLQASKVVTIKVK